MNPNEIENPTKIGIGTSALSGLGSMLHDTAQLHANWFYTWDDALPLVDVTGWSLGSGAYVEIITGDNEIVLDGSAGWAMQTFRVSGGTEFSLSFDVAATASATTGGIYTEFLDSAGRTVSTSFVSIDRPRTYTTSTHLADSITSARLIAYSDGGAGLALDDIEVRSATYTPLINGGFESVTSRGDAAADGFVPMVRSLADLSGLDTLGPVATLLGFNEPDERRQANMTVAEAIAAWPLLMATGARLGSPATSVGNTLGADSWLDRFMSQADENGLRVDFIAVHYYATDSSIDAFKAFLEQVHEAYQRPIWVTEWSLADWNDPGRFNAAQQEAFFTAATQMMDDLPFVERQAWFSTYDGLDGWHLNSALIGQDGALTSLGAVFSKLATTAPPPPPPSPAPERIAHADVVDPLTHAATAALDVLTGTDGADIFRFDVINARGRDRIEKFAHDDLLATRKALRDSNGDGVITFSNIKGLDIGAGNSRGVVIEGIDSAKGLRLLGEMESHFYYGDATVRPDSTATHIVKEGTLADDHLAASTQNTTFFFDNALGVASGHDTVSGFDTRALLVTTRSLGGDSVKDILVTDATGRFVLAGDLSTVTLSGADGSPINAVEYDGLITDHGVTYYVYSAVGSSVGSSDVLV